VASLVVVLESKEFWKMTRPLRMMASKSLEWIVRRYEETQRVRILNMGYLQVLTVMSEYPERKEEKILGGRVEENQVGRRDETQIQR
jgi:hypothetical protein